MGDGRTHEAVWIGAALEDDLEDGEGVDDDLDDHAGDENASCLFVVDAEALVEEPHYTCAGDHGRGHSCHYNERMLYRGLVLEEHTDRLRGEIPFHCLVPFFICEVEEVSSQAIVCTAPESGPGIEGWWSCWNLPLLDQDHHQDVAGVRY